MQQTNKTPVPENVLAYCESCGLDIAGIVEFNQERPGDFGSMILQVLSRKLTLLAQTNNKLKFLIEKSEKLQQEVGTFVDVLRECNEEEVEDPWEEDYRSPVGTGTVSSEPPPTGLTSFQPSVDVEAEVGKPNEDGRVPVTLTEDAVLAPVGDDEKSYRELYWEYKGEAQRIKGEIKKQKEIANQKKLAAEHAEASVRTLEGKALHLQQLLDKFRELNPELGIMPPKPVEKKESTANNLVYLAECSKCKSAQITAKELKPGGTLLHCERCDDEELVETHHKPLPQNPDFTYTYQCIGCANIKYSRSERHGPFVWGYCEGCCRSQQFIYMTAHEED